MAYQGYSSYLRCLVSAEKALVMKGYRIFSHLFLIKGTLLVILLFQLLLDMKNMATTVGMNVLGMA